MSRFLQSGRRRDICGILAGKSLQAQALKSQLESHYETRIDPKSFYGALDALEQQGFIETQTNGIHDVYTLSTKGKVRLDDHLDWMHEQTTRETERERA
jgi:DNA-binding PadR family transcriptional regulator